MHDDPKRASGPHLPESFDLAIDDRGRSVLTLLSRLETGQENLSIKIDQMHDDSRSDYRELRDKIGVLSAVCPVHADRLIRLEACLIGRAPSGSSHPALTDAKMQEIEARAVQTAESTAAEYTEEITGQIRLDAIAAARVEAAEAATRIVTEHEDNKAKWEREEFNRRDRRLKLYERYLRVASAVLLLFGFGSIIAAWQWCSKAQSALQNTQDVIKTQNQTIKDIKKVLPASRKVQP